MEVYYLNFNWIWGPWERGLTFIEGQTGNVSTETFFRFVGGGDGGLGVVLGGCGPGVRTLE